MNNIPIKQGNSTFIKSNEKLDANQDDKSDRDSVLSPIKTNLFNHQDGTQSVITSMKMSDDKIRRNVEKTPETAGERIPIVKPTRKDTVKKIISLNNFQVIENDGPFHTEGNGKDTLKNSPNVASLEQSKSTPGGDGIGLSQTMKKDIVSPIKRQDDESPSDYREENDTDFDGDRIIIYAAQGEIDKMRNTDGRVLKQTASKMAENQVYGTITPNDRQMPQNKSSQNSSFYNTGPQQVKISEAYALELSPRGQDSSNLGMTKQIILESKWERGQESMETNKLTPSGMDFSANYSKHEDRKFGVAEKDLIKLQNQENNSDLTAVMEGVTPLQSSALSGPINRQNRQITTVFKTTPGVSFEKTKDPTTVDARLLTNPDEEPSLQNSNLVFAPKDEGSLESLIKDNSALNKEREQELMLIQENLIARHILNKSPRAKGHFKAQPVILPDISMGIVGMGLSSMNTRNEQTQNIAQSMTPVIVNTGLISSNAQQRNQTRDTISQMRNSKTNPSPVASLNQEVLSNVIIQQLNNETGSSVGPSGESSAQPGVEFVGPPLHPRHKMGMNLTRITEFQNEIATPHEPRRRQPEGIMRNTKYSQGFDLGTGQEQGSIIEHDDKNIPAPQQKSLGNEVGQITLEKKSMTDVITVDKGNTSVQAHSVAASTTKSMQNALNNFNQYGQVIQQQNGGGTGQYTTTSDQELSQELTLGIPNIGDAYFDPSRNITYMKHEQNNQTLRIQLGVDLNQIHQVNKYDGQAHDYFINQLSDRSRSPIGSPVGPMSPQTGNTSGMMSLFQTRRLSNKKLISPGMNTTNTTGFDNSFYLAGQKSQISTQQYSPKTLQRKKFLITNTARRQDYLSFITQQQKEASFVEQLKKYKEDSSVENIVGHLYQDQKSFMVQGNTQRLNKEGRNSPEIKKTQKRYKDHQKKESNEEKTNEFKKSLSPSQRAESNSDLQHIPEFSGNMQQYVLKKSQNQAVKLQKRPEGESVAITPSGIAQSSITPDHRLNPAILSQIAKETVFRVEDDNQQIYNTFASPNIMDQASAKRTPVILKSQKTMSNLAVNDKNYTHTNNTPRKDEMTKSDFPALDDNKSKGIENNMAVDSEDSRSVGNQLHQQQHKSSINTLAQNILPQSNNNSTLLMSPIRQPQYQDGTLSPLQAQQFNIMPVTEASRMMMIQSQFPPQVSSNTHQNRSAQRRDSGMVSNMKQSMGVGIEKQTLDSGDGTNKQGMSQFASDAILNVHLPDPKSTLRAKLRKGTQHLLSPTYSQNNSQFQFNQQQSQSHLGGSSPNESHLQSLSAFKNLRQSRFADHPEIADELYNHLNQMIIHDSNRNFLEDETKPENYNPNVPQAISLTEARKRSPIMTKGNLKSVYIENHKFGHIPQYDVIDEITTPGTFSTLDQGPKRNHSSLITQNGPVPITETKISYALKKMQSSIDSLKSPKNFKIGGDDPDYDKFKPFCTVIDKRELQQNRQRKATYQQLDTKIAINAQGLKYDLDTFHKTIRIKPEQKDVPKNMFSMMQGRKKANSVLRGPNTVSNSIASPMLSPVGSLQQNINSVLYNNVYNYGQNLQHTQTNETILHKKSTISALEEHLRQNQMHSLHTINSDNMSSTKYTFNGPTPLNQQQPRGYTPRNQSNSGQFIKLQQSQNYSPRSIPVSKLQRINPNMNIQNDHTSRNNSNLNGFGNKQSEITDLSQLQKAGNSFQSHNDQFNQIQSFDAHDTTQQNTQQLTLVTNLNSPAQGMELAGTKTNQSSDQRMISAKNTLKYVQDISNSMENLQQHQRDYKKKGTRVTPIKEETETRHLEGDSTFQKTQQNMFVPGTDVLGPGGVDMNNTDPSRWTQPPSPSAQQYVNLSHVDSVGENVKILQKNLMGAEDIQNSFKQLLQPRYTDQGESQQNTNFFNNNATQYLQKQAQASPQTIEQLLSGLNPRQIYHLQLLSETSNLLGSSYSKTQHLKSILNTTQRKKDQTKGVLLEPQMFEKYKQLRNGANEIHLTQDKGNQQNLFWSMGKRGQRHKSIATVQSTNRLEINSFEHQLQILKDEMEVGGRYQRQMENAFGHGKSSKYNRSKSLLR